MRKNDLFKFTKELLGESIARILNLNVVKIKQNDDSCSGVWKASKFKKCGKCILNTLNNVLRRFYLLEDPNIADII